MWDALDGQPLAYKAKDKCVLVRWVESAARETKEWNDLDNTHEGYRYRSPLQFDLGKTQSVSTIMG
jgi:hypothetical protein